MKHRSPVSALLSAVFTLYFLVVIVSIKLSLKFLKFEPSGYYFRPLAGQDTLWRPNSAVIKFDWDLARDQKWETQFSIPLELSLPRKHLVNCEADREHIGLPHDARFVCLHMREEGTAEIGTTSGIRTLPTIWAPSRRLRSEEDG